MVLKRENRTTRETICPSVILCTTYRTWTHMGLKPGLGDDRSAAKLTNQLTAWSIGLLEKLTGLQLLKKFPSFYGTRMFITAFTRASHPFVS